MYKLEQQQQQQQLLYRHMESYTNSTAPAYFMHNTAAIAATYLLLIMQPWLFHTCVTLTWFS